MGALAPAIFATPCYAISGPKRLSQPCSQLYTRWVIITGTLGFYCTAFEYNKNRHKKWWNL